MAEYGSGIFYGRSNGQRNSPTFPQLGILSLPSELDIGPPINTTAIKVREVSGVEEFIKCSSFLGISIVHLVCIIHPNMF